MLNIFDNALRFGQPARSARTAGQHSRIGIHNQVAVSPQFGEVFLYNRIVEHIRIHSRCKQNGRRRRHNGRRCQIIGNTAGYFSDNIGRSRSDDKDVGPLCQGDVFHAKLGHVIEHGQRHGISRYFPQCQGRNELRRMSRHDTLHFRSGLAQAAGYNGRFISGYAAAYDEDDLFMCERHRRHPFPI